MITWYDLTGDEKAILVGLALSRDGRRKVDFDTWQTSAFVLLRTFQLITLAAKSGSYIYYTLSQKGMRLLLQAPDHADGQRVFPTEEDIESMKSRLKDNQSTNVPPPSGR